jgi:alpha-glucosidase
MHDPALTDNPPAPPGSTPRTRPFDFQLRIHNQSHPDIPLFVQRIRALTDTYDARFTVAEVGGNTAEREMKMLTAGEAHFNSAYGFNFLYAEKLTPALVREALDAWPDVPGMGWPSWAFSNHDAPRWISRWAPVEYRQAYARMVMLLFACLRGNIILWQGEELGMTQVDIGFDDLQDPEAIANWPLTLSRDGARTPMPWQGAKANCGFSTAKPWLPIGADHAVLAVDVQENDPQSMLSHTRRLIAFRNAHDALLSGQMTLIEAAGDLLVFERTSDTQQLMVACNFGAMPLTWELPQPDRWRVINRVNDGDIAVLPAYAGVVLEKIA